MTWQILIWNIFLWSFTGLMIYITKSSLWWLILPALFTGYNSGKEIVYNTEETPEIDPETFQKMKDSVKKGDYRREWI